MRNKKILIIIGIIVIILIIVGWWWVNQDQSSQNLDPQSSQSTNQTSSFFPVSAIKNTIQSIITPITNNIQEIIPGGSDEVEVSDQPIRQIVSQPVADYGFITYQGTSTLFYVEQETGHIFAIATSGVPVRLSNKSIPRIKEVKSAETSAKYYFYISSLDEQNGLMWQKGELAKATSSELVLTPINGNIKALEVSPKGDQVFVLREADGTVIGQILTLNLEVPTTIFTSPFTEWVVEWVSDTKISFQTKPSSGVNGSIYLLDTKTKSFTPIVTNKNGLIGVVNNKADKIIYSTSLNGEINTYLKDLKNDSETLLAIKTIVSKCLWSNDYYITCATPENIYSINYPDSWYQGLISFDDSFWDIGASSGDTYSLIEDLDNQYNFKVDAINLKNITEDLYFLNKKDGSLWIFDL